ARPRPPASCRPRPGARRPTTRSSSFPRIRRCGCRARAGFRPRVPPRTGPSRSARWPRGAMSAGDYLVGVVDDVENGEWFDPAFLQRLAPAAIHLTLADGERKTQNITLG